MNTSWRKDKRSSHERGYTSSWQRAREGFLMSHPLCVMCEQQGRLTAATVVDHVVPHKGDSAVFWDTGNWQSLCTNHHNSHKQRIERELESQLP